MAIHHTLLITDASEPTGTTGTARVWVTMQVIVEIQPKIHGCTIVANSGP